jgi:hypothetical protein
MHHCNWKPGHRWRGQVANVDRHQHDDTTLVIKGPTEAFNPTIGAAVIAKEMRDDPEAARAEWGAELQMVEAHTPVVFVTDLEQRLAKLEAGDKC